MTPSTPMPNTEPSSRLSQTDSIPSSIERITAVISDVCSVVPPVWPLKDYVAVNPFLGLSQRRFLEARQTLSAVRTCDMLLPAAHFLRLFEQGDITTHDVEDAFRQCATEYPDFYVGRDPLDFAQALAAGAATETSLPGAAGPIAERHYHTVSEAIDARLGSSWSSHVITDISRHCASHYDQGQAAWQNPWKHLPLFEAWMESSRISRRMDLLGIKEFRRFVAALPAEPDVAIVSLLEQLAIPEKHWKPFLLCQLLSVAGWASFLRYRQWVAAAADPATHDEHLVGLLAMRLAYDVALAQTYPDEVAEPGSLFPAGEADVAGIRPSTTVLARYLFQVAAETAYRRGLCGSLLSQKPAGAGRRSPEAGKPATTRRTLQMIFCIDVRSEVFRRHLEAASRDVETFGFAGFFGMSLEFVPLGASYGPSQCPVLLTPGFRVHERITTGSDSLNAQAVGRRHLLRRGRKVWKSFQTSATSCFSFVESLGLLYLPKLLGDSFGLTRPVLRANADGVPSRAIAHLGPDLHVPGPDALVPERKIELAAGMLRNLGLMRDFARIVAVCGHASDVVNNPYQAGLDCGACGGHSGESNARVSAALLNDPHVRAGLASRGIVVPEDTWFVPAVHNTTTDQVRFFDIDSLPASHQAEFQKVQSWLATAGADTRLERSLRMGFDPDTVAASELGPDAKAARKERTDDIFRRSRDWSEVRPEWGLAGNAAFIVAPRSRTAGLNLGGRTFMHSYDHAKDPELKVLELIMTAPMIVTSWINLQYYGSAVDNRAFGSGNKLIHNVTSQLGVLLGNGGDLMTGLPWQSVSDGVRLQHDPLRLLVLIEAPRAAVQTMIEKHAGVRDLVTNGWLSLVVREGDTFHRWTADQTWQASA